MERYKFVRWPFVMFIVFLKVPPSRLQHLAQTEGNYADPQNWPTHNQKPRCRVCARSAGSYSLDE